MGSFYGYAGSRKCIAFSSFHYGPSTSLGSVFIRTVDGVPFKRTTMQAKFQILALKNAYRAVITAKGYRDGTLRLVMEEFPSEIHPIQLNIQSSAEQIENEKILANASEEEFRVHDIDVNLSDKADTDSGSGKNTTNIRESEMQRRRKIGLANQGKIPWNKGITHSEETRKRISKRTIEALRDPKVRKKMSECPRSHSEQSKARISYALKKIWGERLRQKRLQENCYLTWARSIAEAAKKGSLGQEELEWDAYERAISDINSQHLQRKADKAKARELGKLRAERAAKTRADNAARHAQLRKEIEKKAKAREMKALARRKSEEMKLKMALSKGLKLKVRQHKRDLGSSASIKREIEGKSKPIVENLDSHLIKKEMMRRRISLAEQIQAVKNSKGEFISNKFLSSTHFSSLEVETGDV